MNQVGYVSEIQDEIAQVNVRRISACGDKCGSCGGGCSVPMARVKMKNTLGAEKGDLVEVKINTNTVLKFAFLVYVIPLLMMIAGIAVGINIFKALEVADYETYGFLIGLVLLAASFLILKLIDKRVKQNESIKFEMVKIIKS